MIIGVDAGALSITDERLRVGVWRVTYNVLRELARIDKKNEYRLYSFIPIGREVMSAFGPRMKNIVVRPIFAWATIQLPIELRRHPVDIFLGLSQMIPYSVSYNIGFIHDLGFLHYPEAYPGSLRRLENQTKALIKRSDYIVTVSRMNRKDIENNFSDLPPVTVAHEGIDRRFTVKGPRHTEKNPYILFVGALKRGKNIPFALRVFKKFLSRSTILYDFVIVGGNVWEDPEIRRVIRELKLTSRVKLKGFVPDKELPSYYRGAKALLITSLWEGFCLPAAEALASGCPVVYARTGALPEIVGSAGSGFAPGDENGAVKALLHRKPPAQGIRRSKQFTWSRFAEAVYRIISST